MNFYIYILTNNYNTTLYIGITNNLERRVLEHKQKKTEGFTSKYNLNKLVYYEQFNNAEDAIAAEKKLKGWKRIKKDNLIENINPEWIDLAEEILR